MSRYDYLAARRLLEIDPPFTALIMAAMRKADTDNAARLRRVFPEVDNELHARYWAPGAVIPTDPEYADMQEALRSSAAPAGDPNE